MGTFFKPLPNCAFLNAVYIPPEENCYGHDAIIASVKDIETGETKLHIIKNPQTQVYVMREGLRMYDHKREYAKKTDCDMYITTYKDQYNLLAHVLGVRPGDEFFTKRAVQASPFAFGWDIDPLVRLKCDYLDTCKKSATKLKIGMLDIETSVLGDEQILCLSICNWSTREVHCFILNEPWLRLDPSESKKLQDRVDIEYPKFVDGLNPKARKIWDEKPIKPYFHLCDDERKLLVEAFKYYHSCKFDFMGVWNMGFDLPYIIKRAEFRQLNLAELFCHPDIPSEFKMCNWKEDKSKVDHFTDVWHWLYAPGYTTVYDAMCLYSRLRKVKGRDVFYTLDYIGNKIIGAGKMHFGANESHYLMQTNDKIGYCVYNTLDVVIPALMDAITYDVASMLELSDCSNLCDFSKQTVQLKAQFFRYLSGLGCVPGSVAGSIKAEYDEVIGNIGGAVLNPTLMKVKGVPCLTETNQRSSIYRLSADLDVSSFYPSVTVAFNVSRETKLATVLWIEGCPYTIEDIQNTKDTEKQKVKAKANAEYFNALFGRITCVDENAVNICHEHFGLPDYHEMLDIFSTKES